MKTGITSIASILFLFATVAAKVKAQATECDPTNTANAIADLVECQTSNAGCSDCEADESATPDFGAGNLPNSKEDIEQIFCPAINCCSACVDQTKSLLQCSVDVLCTAFSLPTATCQLDCDPSTYPYGDGVAEVDPCEAAAGTLAACLIRDGSCFTNEQDQCFDQIQDLETTLQGDAGSLAALTNCDIAEAYFCTYISCCPECQDELRAVYACEVDESSFVAECSNLSCMGDVAPANPPAGNPTDAPVGGSTDPQGGATLAPNGGTGTETEPLGDSSANSLGLVGWFGVKAMGMIVAAIFM